MTWPTPTKSKEVQSMAAVQREFHEADVLVMGGGMAGLVASIAARATPALMSLVPMRMTTV